MLYLLFLFFYLVIMLLVLLLLIPLIGIFMISTIKICRIIFYYRQKLLLLSIVFITMLPLKILFSILSFYDYYCVLVVFTTILSTTLSSVYNNGRLPRISTVFMAIFFSLLIFIFIRLFFSYLSYTLPYENVIIYISNILLLQGISLAMNGSGGEENVQAAATVLSSIV